MKLDMNYIGSFQTEGSKFVCENPLDEVWTQVARHGTDGFLRNAVPDNKNIDWEGYKKYAQVRVWQSLEFRNAVRKATLLTGPLPLYYSFLNLTRAMLALGPEILPRNTHGLSFIKSADLLGSKAQLQRGTFTEYLDSMQIPWGLKTEISLGEALGFVIEDGFSYASLAEASLFVQPIIVHAKMSGEVKLEFHEYPGNFEATWAVDFPQLVDECVFIEKNFLLVKDPTVGKSYEGIQIFLRKYLMPPLILQSGAVWFAYRQNNPVLKLNRTAYYYIATFILGSVVRYEPELMLSVNTKNSETGWYLEKFLKNAERYFPQLKLMEQWDKEVYFSGSH